MIVTRFGILTILIFDSIVMALAHNDWFTTFSIQQADISATMLQESILDAIQRFVPLKSFRRSFFLSWVSPALKSLLFKKIISS